MRVYTPHACLVPKKAPGEVVGFLGTLVADGCESLCGCWGWNLAPLEEQSVP